MISTTWEGEATDQELLDALRRYETEIKGRSEYADYNEVVSFRGSRAVKLTSGGLVKIAQMVAKSDQSIPNTKLAIVVSSSLSFGFAKIYETYRRFTPRNRKIVRLLPPY